MKKLLLLALFICLQKINAQSWQWSYSFGCYNDSAYGHSIAHDAQNNCIITGNFVETVDFDPGPFSTILGTTNTSLGYVAKYDATGNFLWAFSIGSSTAHYADVKSVCTDGAGNIFITGVFLGTIDFDPGSATHALVGVYARNGDIFLAKYDANGNYLWAHNYGGSGNYGNGGNNVATDKNGNVFVTGGFQGTTDFNPGSGVNNLTSTSYFDAFLAKYDAAGNYIWAFNIPGATSNYQRTQGLSVDSAGNAYLSGYLKSSADFDPGAGTHTLTINGYQDMFLAKYTAAGNYDWAFNIGTASQSAQALSSAIDANNNVFVTGFFRGTMDFNPGAASNYIASHTTYGDIFLAKYDSAGNYLWAKDMGSTGPHYNFGFGVATDGNNAFVTGCFGGTADFDPSANTVNLAALSASDIFLASYDGGGNYLWAFNLGSSTSTATYYGNMGYNVTANQSGDVWLTGWIQGQGTDMDPGPGVYNIDVQPGEQDILMAKYSTTPTGIKEQPLKDGAVSLYPNPAKGKVTVSHTEDILLLEVSDAIGNLVYSAKPGAKNFNFSLDNEGVYFVTIRSASGSTTQKMVIEK